MTDNPSERPENDGLTDVILERNMRNSLYLKKKKKKKRGFVFIFASGNFFSFSSDNQISLWEKTSLQTSRTS